MTPWGQRRCIRSANSESRIERPLESAVSRHLEAEADWVALTTTADPRNAEALFEEFTRIALADPSPPTWAYVLFSTHPTVEQRIAMARAFAAR